MPEPTLAEALRTVAEYARMCLVFASDYQRKQRPTEALRVTFRPVPALEST